MDEPTRLKIGKVYTRYKLTITVNRIRGIAMSKKVDNRIVLIIACMAAFITPFLGSSVNIAIPTITGEFHADNFLMNWVVLGFLLSAAIFVVPFGRIADIVGRKTIFIIGLIIIVVSSLLCSLSNSVYMLIASRMLEGFGSAMIFGTLVAILTAAYPAKERGKVLGINVAITYLGLSAGPFIGGIITQYLGWRFIYAGIMAYSLIIAGLAYFLIKDNERCAGSRKFRCRRNGTVRSDAFIADVRPLADTGHHGCRPYCGRAACHGNIFMVGASPQEPGPEDQRLPQ